MIIECCAVSVLQCIVTFYYICIFILMMVFQMDLHWKSFPLVSFFTRSKGEPLGVIGTYFCIQRPTWAYGL